MLMGFLVLWQSIFMPFFMKDRALFYLKMRIGMKMAAYFLNIFVIKEQKIKSVENQYTVFLSVENCESWLAGIGGAW